MIEFRCFKCEKLLARCENKARIEIVCPRCKSTNSTNDGLEHNKMHEDFMNEELPPDHPFVKLFNSRGSRSPSVT